jgi:hypothetical protein
VANAMLRSGLNPDEPDRTYLVVVVDPSGQPGDRAVSQHFDSAYEGDGAFHVLQSYGWVERHLDGDVLTVDVVTHPAVLKDLDLSSFHGRSSVDAEAIRLVRTTVVVDPAEYARAPELTLVLSAPASASPDDIASILYNGEDWPHIYAPPPEN